jgi:Flp pilus assembly protein TadG
MRLSYFSDQGGAAALEFGLIVGMLVLPMMSVVDIGIYTYDKIQLENAAQVAAQSVWTSCDASKQPVTRNCSLTYATVNGAAQGATSLGNGVSVTALNEVYYCVDGSGVLQSMSAGAGSITSAGVQAATAQSSCGSGSWVSTAPADYITVQVTYTYRPVFGSVSVGQLLGSSITKTTTMRMG